MAQTILIKRSNTSGAAPTTSQLSVGELALNTRDGKIYMRKYVDGTTGNDTITLIGDTSTLAGSAITGNLSFSDNVKAQFGASNDLQIYHDGSNSYATSDTGQFFLTSSNSNIWLRGVEGGILSADGSEYLIRATSNGSVKLYHNNVKKLETTSTGIDVIGTATMDGLTSSSTIKIDSATPALWFYENDATDLNGFIRNVAGDLLIQTINDAGSAVNTRLSVDHATGDVSFYEDTGTTAKLTWDASAESLGIGRTNPASYVTDGNSLYVKGQIRVDGISNTAALPALTLNDTNSGIFAPAANTIAISTGAGERIRVASNGDIQFYEDTGTTAKMVWDASAESLGIGGSPIAALDVKGTDAVGTLTSLADTVTRAAAIIRGSNHGNGYGLYMGYGNQSTDAQYIQATRENGASAFPLLLNPYGGNVGIGTASPSYKLSVSGNIGLTDGVSTGLLAMVGGNYYIQNTGAYSTIFQTNGAERMRITSAGLVGIGVSAPTYKIDATTTSGGNGIKMARGANSFFEQFQSTTGGVQLAASGSGAFMAFRTGATAGSSTERLKIATGGAITFNQAFTFPTADGSANQVIKTDGSGNMSWVSVAVGVPTYLADADNNTKIQVEESSDENKIRFDTAGSERMIIDAAGNVGIGTSAPAEKLHVYSAGASKLLIEGDSTGAVDSVGIRYKSRGTTNWFTGIGSTATGTASSDFIVSNGTDANTNIKLLIDTVGNVGIGTSSPAAKLQVEALGIDTTTTSTTATTQVAIDSMVAATFRSARYTIQVTNSTDSTYHLTEMLLIHNGTTPSISEFGTIFTGSAAEAAFTADISSGNVRILATPASTDAMAFKVIRHSITV